MYSKFIPLLFIIVSCCAISEQQLTQQHLTGKTYKVGVFASPPLSFIGENRLPVGFIIDIFNEISFREGLKITWVYNDWKHLLALFENHEIDILTSVEFTHERSSFMDYSEHSFITAWGQVFLPSDSHIESIIDLDNKKIGVLINDANGRRLISRCEQFEITCNVIYFETYEKIFTEIASGKIDAGVSKNLVGNSYLEQYKLISSGIVFNPFKLYITVPKNTNQNLLAIFDRYIEHWKKNPKSFYYTTRLKWLNQKPKNELSIIVMYIMIALLVFAIVAMIFAFFFKRQVNRRVLELTKRDLQLNQIINLVPHMIYVTDTNGNIMLANKTASDYFGMSVQEFEACNVTQLSQKNKRFNKLLNIKNTNSKGSINKQREIQAKDFQGSEHTLYLSKTPYVGSVYQQQSTVTVAVDITNIKQFEEKIKFIDSHDSLTKLPNRILLKDRIDHSLIIAKRTNTSGCILFIGLDHFKNINDSQGHLIGDLLLIEVANRLRECTPIGDTIARLGGDEFIVELSNLHINTTRAQHEAEIIAQVILDIISKPYTLEAGDFHITASIGAVLYPKDGATQEILLQRADTAIYHAKANGRNCIKFFKEEFESFVINKHNIESDLRLAILEKQFFIEYQPVVYGKNKKIVGCEALIRWHHPEKGIIHPGDFIEIAEQKNLIIPIGDWVLEQSCRQIQLWIKSGRKNFFIAVNVSVIQIREENFYAKVLSLIQEYKIPANFLELEVTESLLMEETERSISVFKKLRLLGVRISIDDFGTGYSSFNYLMTFPLDKIKIDQSFIKDLPNDANSITIVTTILRMAKELGMDVVAEGVENQQQYDFLKSQQCQYYQGFYFCKPIASKELFIGAKEVSD